MELQTVFVDRGQSAGLGAEPARPDRLYLAFVARNAVASVDAQLASFWLVVRGSVDVVAREGRFQLHAGDWISLERDSRPWLRLGRGALVVGQMRERIFNVDLLNASTSFDLSTGGDVFGAGIQSAGGGGQSLRGTLTMSGSATAKAARERVNVLFIVGFLVLQLIAEVVRHITRRNFTDIFHEAHSGDTLVAMPWLSWRGGARHLRKIADSVRGRPASNGRGAGEPIVSLLVIISLLV